MESENKLSIGRIINYAGALIAFMIGSAYATGQEVMQFFAAFGVWQCVGAFLLTLVLMTYLCSVIMEDGRKLQLKRPADLFKYYCGKQVGIAMEILTALYLYSLFVVMVSGSGTILEEHFGIPKMIGMVAMACVALATVLLGLKRIVQILGKLGVVIIVLALSVGVINTILNFGALGEADAYLATVEPLKASDYWWWSGILYPAECCIFVVSFLAAMGITAKSKKEALISGGVGGALFSIGLLTSSLGMLVSIKEVFHLHAPTIGVADNIIPGLGSFYSVIVIIGIYTTAVPLLWTPIMSITTNEKSSTFRILAVAGTILALLAGQLNFKVLINIIIPLAGWAGLIVPISIIVKHLKIRIPGYNTRYDSKEDFEKAELPAPEAAQ